MNSPNETRSSAKYERRNDLLFGLNQENPQYIADQERFAPMIKPDYNRIRSLYMLICALGIVLVLLMQIALYLVFKLKLLPIEFKTSEFVHLLKYLIIPSSINIPQIVK